MDAILTVIKSPWAGAAVRIEALCDAEHAANRARLDAYDTILAPLVAAHEAAFEAHGDGPESAAAYAALVAVASTMNIHEPTHPGYAPLSAAHDVARAAVPAAALSYVVATTLLPTLLRVHNGAGWPAGEAPEVPDLGEDCAAILWALPEGPLPGFPGWRKVTVSPHGAWERLREVRLCYGKRIVAVADNRGRTRVTNGEEETRRLEEAKARNRAHHAEYQAQLADVREALAVDPALRGTLLAYVAFEPAPADVAAAAQRIEAAPVAAGVEPRIPPDCQWDGWEADLALYEGWMTRQYHRGHLARVCLALDGWAVREGQEGGTVTPPWGGVPVGVRGALRLPREGGR